MRAPGVRLLALLGCAVLFGCGDDPAPVVEPGPHVAQEIWVTYNSPAHRAFGRRTGLTRDEALRKANDLRARVLAGEDVGELAKQHSNAPGGMASGFSDWRATNPAKNDARDQALLRTPIGGVTPVVEWLGGWWFARRIPAARGRELQARFEHMNRLRAKVRAIAVVWKDASWLTDEDVVHRTKEQAYVRAAEALRLALASEDFGDLALRYSDDKPSREQGGLVKVRRAPDERPTEWLRVIEEGFDRDFLAAAFEGEPGKVWPAIIESDGVLFLLKVEERRLLEPDPPSPPSR